MIAPSPLSPSLLVCFDTSTPTTAITVVEQTSQDGAVQSQCLASVTRVDQGSQASAQLVADLEACLQQANRSWTDVTAIGCGVGPGTFTGTRVAVATAKGYAIALDIPVLAIDTLAAIACSAGIDGRVLATIDARRGELYVAGYELRANADQVEILACWLEATAKPIDEVAALLDSEPTLVVAGTGLHELSDEARERHAAQLHLLPGPTAQGLTAACAWHDACDQAQDAQDIGVFYLRQSYAEIGVHVPKRAPFVCTLLDDELEPASS